MPRQYTPEFRQKSVRMLETALEADAELWRVRSDPSRCIQAADRRGNPAPVAT